MIVEPKPLNEITKEALKVLSKEIGIVNTIRFLNQFTTGYGNYTEDREQLFADMSLEEVLAAIKQRKNQPSA